MQKINNSTYKTIKILISPLDWGLGHATRCVPIIKELINQKCEVCIAAAGAQKMLLQEEFPYLSVVELPGYGVKYGKNRALTILRLIFTFPKILIRIKQENRWLRQFIALQQPDAIISDNRYGLHAPGLPSIIITHQLRIRSPFGTWIDDRLQKLNYRAIGKFSRCWIPDEEGPLSLAGKLSHPYKLPAIPTRYIGWLSRLEVSPQTAAGPKKNAGLSPLLILLSGPEPQRTILEQKVLQQVPSYPGPITLIRGLPDKSSPALQAPSNITIHDHLPAGPLAALIQQAEFVLCRAGYSTVMDLAKLGTKAILIPTPGQTEQEYLGAWLAERRFALCIQQKDFSLPKAMAAARKFPFTTTPPGDSSRLHREIRSFLAEMRPQEMRPQSPPPDFG